MNSLQISIFESIYLIYMFLFFKTSIDFNILSSPNMWLFKHLIGDTYGLRICPFGQIAIFALIFILIFRNFINISPILINISFVIAVILSLINLNALVYLIPVLLVEFVKNRI